MTLGEARERHLLDWSTEQMVCQRSLMHDATSTYVDAMVSEAQARRHEV